MLRIALKIAVLLYAESTVNVTTNITVENIHYPFSEVYAMILELALEKYSVRLVIFSQLEV
jgi:hypothetical protein